MSEKVDDKVVDNPEGNQEPEGKQEPEEKVFTQEDVNRIIGERIAREKEKFLEEKKEAERIAKLSAEEQAEERRKQREAEIEEKEKELNFRELEIETKHKLADEGIPNEFTPYLIRHDKASTEEAISTFKEVWEKNLNDKVEELVNEKIGTPVPKRGQTVPKVGKGFTDPLAELAKNASIR